MRHYEGVIPTDNLDPRIQQKTTELLQVLRSPIVSNNPDQLLETIKSAIEQDEYGTALKQLAALRDLKNNITWHVDSENKIILRDARNVVGQPKFGFEAYAMRGINNIRAAKALLQIRDKHASPLHAELNQLAVEFITQFNQATTAEQAIKLLTKFNDQLIAYVSRNTGEKPYEIKQRFSDAKDFANLEDEAFSIGTLSKTDDQQHTVVELDVPLFGLTEEQKSEYLQRDTKKWYQVLPKWHQQLVDQYTPEILAENRVLPTQLRKSTVGIRNAYDKLTGMLIDDAKSTASIDVLAVARHSGTITQLTKNEVEGQRLSNLNAVQMKQLNDGNPIHMISLNSETNFVNNDRRIVKQTHEAINSLTNGSVHSNLTMNAFRKFVSNGNDGIEQQLYFVAGLVKVLGQKSDRLQILSRFIAGQPLTLNEDINKQLVDQNYQKLIEVNPKIKKLLDAALKMRRTLLDNKRWDLDPNNRNLSLASLSYMIHNELLTHPELCSENDFSAYVMMVITACQSGKDRVYVVLVDHTKEQVHYAITGEIESDQQKKNAIVTTIARAGHAQFMAGIQGGTIGCFGIKSDTKAAIPKTYPKDAANMLVLDTAKRNKKLFTDVHRRTRLSNLSKPVTESDEQKDSYVEFMKDLVFVDSGADDSDVMLTATTDELYAPPSYIDLLSLVENEDGQLQASMGNVEAGLSHQVYMSRDQMTHGFAVKTMMDDAGATDKVLLDREPDDEEDYESAKTHAIYDYILQQLANTWGDLVIESHDTEVLLKAAAFVEAMKQVYGDALKVQYQLKDSGNKALHEVGVPIGHESFLRKVTHAKQVITSQEPGSLDNFAYHAAVANRTMLTNSAKAESVTSAATTDLFAHRSMPETKPGDELRQPQMQSQEIMVMH